MSIEQGGSCAHKGGILILGPPGCGKTTRLLREIAQVIAGGTDVCKIAFVTFTRAARLEAIQRVSKEFGFGERDLPWFRTIHSAAFRLLGLTYGQVLGPRHWEEFAKQHSYRLSRTGATERVLEEGNLAPYGEHEDDLLRYAHSWGRNRRLTTEETLTKFPGEGLSASAFLTFVRRLEAFKDERRLLDFNELLERVLAGQIRPPVDVIFVDEAQDLSPLQIAVVQMWFRTCERVYVAGDDDQAVYTFQGAEPDYLVELSRTWQTEILEQSYRVPASAHGLAERIIRVNQNRVPKEYRAAPHVGEIRRESREQAFDLLDGSISAFVLARNRISLRPYAYELLERAIPYIVEGEGGPSPLSNERLMRAVNAAIRIHNGQLLILGTDELDALLSYVATGDGLVRRGTKQRVKEACKEGVDVDAKDLDLDALFDAIRTNGPLSVFVRLSVVVRRYFEKLLAKYGELPQPKIHLTSIHGSKGREADLVVLISDMSRATYDEYRNGRAAAREAENRVFYVGVTRARRTLVLVTPRSRRHFEYPSLGGGSSAWREQFEERAAIAEFDGNVNRAAAEAMASASSQGRVAEVINE